MTLRNYYTFSTGVCLFLTFALQTFFPVLGQDSKIPEKKNATTAPLITQEQIDDWGKKINEAKVDLESLQAGLSTKTTDTPGISVAEQQKKVALMIRRLATLQQFYDAAKSYQENLIAAQDLENAMNSWSGFPGKPPYNMEVSDGLRRSISLLEQEIANKEFRQTMDANQLQEAKNMLEKSKQSMRKLNDKFEGETDPVEQTKLRWLRQLKQLEIQLAEDTVVTSELMIQMSEYSLSVSRKNLAFQKNKLYSILPQTVFSREELDKKLKDLEHTRAQDDKKLLEIEKRDHAVEGIIAGLRVSLAKEKESGNALKIAAAERELEVSLFLQKNLRSQIEELRILTLSNPAMGYYLKERFRLSEVTDPVDLNEMRSRIQKGMVRLEGYIRYFQNSMRPLREQIQLVDYYMDGSSPRIKKILDEITEIQQQRVKILDRGVIEGQILQRLAEGILDEISSKTSKRPVEDKMMFFLKQIPKVMGDVWHYEVFAVEDAIIIDGQTYREKRAVSVGKILIALIMLFVGIWSGRHLISFSDRIAVQKLKMRPQWALLWSRILYTLLVVLILISALALVKIPLTAFAFAGGALAIGVGFGAQNLINNFISSFILMAEQPIKVGDLVEVEGSRGRVTQIGARCVQVRRFDGIEILIPNSTFLEKSVVNLTLSDDINRYTIFVGVAYGSPTRHVDALLKQIALNHPEVLKIPPPSVVFEDFGDSALKFKLLFWLRGSSDINLVSTEIRHRIDEAFRTEKIVMAFPQRDIHLDVTKPVQVLWDKET